MRRVQLVMFALILVAAVRARSELLTDRPLTWVMGAGFVLVFAGSLLSEVRDARPRHTGRHTLRPHAP
jgi:drug/metabolite transporter (DMT)-like permease